MSHLTDLKLNDYADGLLPEAEREEARRHLADCAGCRARLEELQELLRRAAELPAARLERDLWPDVQSELRPARPRWRQLLPLAASVVLVSAAALSALWLLEGGQPSSTASDVVPVARESIGLDDLRAAEQEFVRAAELLMEQLERRREELPPGTVESFERNFELLDRAIADAHRAIEQADGGPPSSQVLSALHHQKMRMLRRATRLSSS